MDNFANPFYSCWIQRNLEFTTERGFFMPKVQAMISEVDKQIEIIELAKEKLLPQLVQTLEDGGIALDKCYSSVFDGLILYPKTITGAERDEVTGEAFKLINKKHKPFMRYGATKLIQLIDGCTLETAKNRAKAFLNNPTKPAFNNNATLPQNLIMPQDYHITGEGIFIEKIKNNVPYQLEVNRTLYYPTERIKDLDTDEERLNIQYIRDNKHKNIIVDAYDIATKKNITELRKYGILVNDTNAKDNIKWLSDFEGANYDTLPIKSSVSRTGWQSNGVFIPYSDTDLIFYDKSNKTQGLKGYKAKGKLSDWISVCNALINVNYIMRALVIASASAPFLRLINQRAYYLYNWGESGGGKTAGLAFAQSIWGDPKVLMINYNTTAVGFELMAEQRNDLPLCINERQVIGRGDKAQGQLEQMVYMGMDGTGKVRGSKNATLRQVKTWRAVILGNGEQPLIDSNTPDGVSTRVIEIEGVPFNTSDIAKDMYDFVLEHHGVFGQAIIGKLLQSDNIESVKVKIKDLKSKALTILGTQYADRKDTIIDYVSYMVSIDVLLSMTLLERFTDEEQAFNNAIETFAKPILEGQKTKQETDVTEKFYKTTCDWLEMNRNKFYLKDKTEAKQKASDPHKEKLFDFEYVPNGEIWGLIEQGDNWVNIYVIPRAFDTLCKQEQQNKMKMLKAFASKDYIETYTENRKDRQVTTYTVTKKMNGKPTKYLKFIYEDMPF